MEDKTIQLKLELETKLAKANLQQTEVAINKLTQSFRGLTKGTNDYKAAQSKLAQLQVKYAKQTESFSNSVDGISNSMNGVSRASGSASASVLEIGRTISDSNYGMQGMANNLSQLASNFVYTTKAAGGLAGGLKALGSAMLGPLGIIVLVQTVIAVFERMAMEANNLEDKLKDLNDTGITESVVKLMLLKDALNDTTMSLKDKNGVIRTAREEYKDLTIAIDDTGVATAGSVVAIDAEIDALMRSAKAKAVVQLASELMTEQIKAETSDLEDNISWYEKAWLGFVHGNKKGRAKAKEQAKENRKEDVDEFQDSIDKLLEKLKEDADPNDPKSGILLQWVYGLKKDRLNSRNRANKIFKEGILDLEKFILTKNRDFQLAAEDNEFEQLKIKQKFAQDDLELTKETFKTKQKLRFKQFVEAQAKRLNMSVEEYKAEKSYAEEKAKLDKSISDAELSYTRASDSLQLLQAEETANKKLEIELKYAELISKTRVGRARSEWDSMKATTGGTKAGSLGSPMSSVGAEGIESQIASQRALNEAELDEFNRAEEERRTDLENSLLSTMEVESILFEERMVFQNTMAVREIELERQKIDAKKNINLEYVSWIEGLSSVFSNIAGENEALATAALVLEKGAAIAKVVISTTAANQEIVSTSGKEAAKLAITGKANIATGAAMAILNPLQGGALMKAGAGQIAAAGATKAAAGARIAKNKAGAAISIASILSTTLASRGGGGGSSSGGGGGGAGGGGRTFDFNLVGSTGENQLAQGIASQVGTPVQAFVVSSQMTSQQQLDNAIQTSATLGD